MPPKDKEPTCVWKHQEWEDAWLTSCEGVHWFADGTPEENDYKFCPYCGKKLEVKNEHSAL